MKTNKESFLKSNYKIIVVSCVLFLCACSQSYKEENISLYKEYDMVEETSAEEFEPQEYNTEEYAEISENKFLDAMSSPVSTFSIDVDNASYANVRRFLTEDQMPPADAVRIEEMVNYFSYNYEQPRGKHPFAITNEVSQCPWNKENKLVHIGIQGKSLDYDDLKPSNLVFLIDASGSMGAENKLPLLKKSLKILLDELGDEDRVAIVAYAGSAGLVLNSTSASDKEEILDALDNVSSGGSTAGGKGIELAYKIALENLIEDGNNRVILATDGDFNVGPSSPDALVELIEEKRKANIFLTICGFGMGNYKDDQMEQISNAGNGNYFYIDNSLEAQKVFKREMRANMFTIAKDVKIQIEFNPKAVKAYRLIGYENRMLAREDFEDDKKDAGELGAGHTVTALYEIVPANGSTSNYNGNLKYQTSTLSEGHSSEEMLTLKMRYKPINSDRSIEIVREVANSNNKFEHMNNDFRFSAAVASFGMLLRESEYSGTSNYNTIRTWASNAKGTDEMGYRAEFIQLVELANLNN